MTIEVEVSKVPMVVEYELGALCGGDPLYIKLNSVEIMGWDCREILSEDVLNVIEQLAQESLIRFTQKN